MAPDDDLLTAFRAGDAEAFEELFARYRDAIWAFFARRIDRSTAEELVQETFATLLESAPRYEARGAFRSYLFSIAFNLLNARRRGARREAAFQTLKDAAPQQPVDPSSFIWVRRALDALDTDDREVLMLREYDQLRYDEIAAAIGVPINTVRSRLFRARTALRDQLLGTTATPRSGVTR
jgi:RNA polymerase sigma-70 factor (ECF subfamily)